MRRMRWWAVPGAAAGMVALGITGAAEADRPAPPGRGSWPAPGDGLSIFLAAHQEERVDVDHGPAGPSTGDYFVLRNTLRDDRGKKVGTSAGTFTLVDAATSLRLCTVTLQLPPGTLTLQGLATVPGTVDNTVAVTGGTGLYRDASGEVTFTPKDPATLVDHYTLRISDLKSSGWSARAGRTVPV
jgi:hypothetical protein